MLTRLRCPPERLSMRWCDVPELDHFDDSLTRSLTLALECQAHPQTAE